MIVDKKSKYFKALTWKFKKKRMYVLFKAFEEKAIDNNFFLILHFLKHCGENEQNC